MLPLVFMILLGIYWCGMAFNTYATINYAARAGARVGVAQTCATCTNANNPPSTTNVASAVTQALQASAVDPAQIIVFSPTPTSCGPSPTPCTVIPGSNITFCNQIQLSPVTSAGPPVCGVSVSFRYPYQFWLPFTPLNMQRITLTADVQMAGEY